MAPPSKNPRKKNTPPTRGRNAALEALKDEVEFLDRQSEEEAVLRGVRPGRFDEPPEIQLGQRVQETREAMRMTQGELSKLTTSLDSENKGISRAVVSLYEAGTNRPSPREIRLLCEALQITPNYLIYGNDDPFDELMNEKRLGSTSRADPEGFAWMSYVMQNIHHNHYDAVMKLVLDLARGWNKNFDHDLRDEANRNLLRMAAELEELLKKRKSLNSEM